MTQMNVARIEWVVVIVGAALVVLPASAFAGFYFGAPLVGLACAFAVYTVSILALLGIFIWAMRE